MIKIFPAIAITLFCSGCLAYSSLGSARVRLMDNEPCFAPISEHPVLMTAISVSEAGATADWKTLAQELWAVTVDSPGDKLELSTEGCIKYGELPPKTKTLHPAQMLMMHKAYNLFIEGKSGRERRNMLGYGAAFCLIPSEDGKTIAAATVYDRTAEKWRDTRCRANPPK
jgi:hypothetical protein